MNKLETALNILYSDLWMLHDGAWVPDHHSAMASIEVIEGIVTKLKAKETVSDDFELIADDN